MRRGASHPHLLARFVLRQESTVFPVRMLHNQTLTIELHQQQDLTPSG